MHIYNTFTSGSESIASRVKQLRRPINKKQKQSRPPGTAFASLGSKQYHMSNSFTGLSGLVISFI